MTELLAYFQRSPPRKTRSQTKYLLRSLQSSAPSLFLPHIHTWGPPRLLFACPAPGPLETALRNNMFPHSQP
jgi:hypothetical protein